ncbi:MAG TPA: transposase, partial [Chloroflexi bacterium]|nr:transposase [Chloroflexota bacterium]
MPTPARITRARARRYGGEVQEALRIAWEAANFICAKRLVPFLGELVPSLERHGHLNVSDGTRAQLVAISPATADRLLRRYREGDTPRGLSTTKAGTLLKHQVPVRTFADWNDVTPGFLEADLVAHCGTSVEGS